MLVVGPLKPETKEASGVELVILGLLKLAITIKITHSIYRYVQTMYNE